MAYPPTIPPNNRADGTATPTNHINDHNQTSDALTDIVSELDATITDLATVTSDLATVTSDLATLDARSPYCLFDHYANVGNVGTGEDDLYSDTLPAGLLAANGDKIELVYGLTWVSSATATHRVRVYFGGTVVADNGTYVSNGGSPFVGLRILIERVSASVVRATATGSFPAPTAVTTLPIAAGVYTEVTGLTLANTQIVKVTGEAAGVGAATDDIIARQGYGLFIPAA